MQTNGKTICVLSTGTQRIEWIFKITNYIKQQYCLKYNYQFRFNKLLNVNDNDSYYTKIQYIQKYLNKYDYVLWMDCDAWFNNFNISIESLILKYLNDNNKCFLIAYNHSTTSIDEYIDRYVNTGVMLFKNTLICNTILNTLFDINDNYIQLLKNRKTFLYDQTLICMKLLCDSTVRKYTSICDPVELNYFVKMNNINNQFILHMCGLNIMNNREQFYKIIQHTCNINNIKIQF